MPTAPQHPCPRCGRLTYEAYCERHRRPSAAARGYDDEWATLARDWLRRFPYCGQRLDGERYAEHSRCTRLGLSTVAQVVDHIRPIRDAPEARLDLRNLQSLCASCNTRKR